MSVAGKPLKWWVVIAEWEQGIRVRLGKHSRVLVPGIHFRVPFLDRIYVQNTRLRTCSLTGLSCTTKDGKSLVVSAAYNFCVRDMLKFYNTMSNPEIRMNAVVSSHIVRKVLETKLSDVNIDMFLEGVDWSEFEAAGLSDLSVTVTAFSMARTYRLVNDAGYWGAGLGDLEAGHGAKIER